MKVAIKSACRWFCVELGPRQGPPIGLGRRPDTPAGIRLRPGDRLASAGDWNSPAARQEVREADLRARTMHPFLCRTWAHPCRTTARSCPTLQNVNPSPLHPRRRKRRPRAALLRFCYSHLCDTVQNRLLIVFLNAKSQRRREKRSLFASRHLCVSQCLRCRVALNHFLNTSPAGRPARWQSE